jgi:nucleotide-binding universal stress UspA family protein
MAPVLCGIDDRSASKDAARAAIDFCRESGADLTLVGVTRPAPAFTQPAGGELIRRFQDVEQQVLKAARAAREEGVTAKIVFRAGDPAEQLVREAESVGATDVFLGSTPTRLGSLFTRDAGVTVNRLVVPTRVAPAEVDLAVAA